MFKTKICQVYAQGDPPLSWMALAKLIHKVALLEDSHPDLVTFRIENNALVMDVPDVLPEEAYGREEGV